jgi:hypothetical protein
MRFVLIGYAYRPLRNVKTTGPYRAEEAAGLIEREGCDALLFTAQWPETYSYTLSVALTTGLPIIAPDVGAFPERLSGRPHAWVFPFPSSAEMLLEGMGKFLADLQSGHARAAPVVSVEPHPTDLYGSRYFADAAAAHRAADMLAVRDCLAPLLARPPAARASRRERILKLLWLAYSDRRLRGIANLIPHRVKRGIKRLLSRKPLHEIFRGR